MKLQPKAREVRWWLAARGWEYRADRGWDSGTPAYVWSHPFYGVSGMTEAQAFAEEVRRQRAGETETAEVTP